mgnify:CR=1 FL=1
MVENAPPPMMASMAVDLIRGNRIELPGRPRILVAREAVSARRSELDLPGQLEHLRVVVLVVEIELSRIEQVALDLMHRRSTHEALRHRHAISK